LLAAAGAALVIVVGAFVAFRGGDEKSKRPKIPEAQPQLDTGGVALASLLKAGRGATYHARYTSSTTASGRATSIEAWNAKDKSRVDTITKAADGGTVKTSSFLLKGKAVACQQPPKGDWTCKKTEAPADGDAAGLTAALTAQLAGRSVSEHAEDVNGVKARCFTVSAKEGTEEVDACANAQGVLVRLASPSARLEIAKLDGAVSDADFELPATPTG
jgi:hypothetical protein